MTTKLLYIIHAAEDKALAGYLKLQVQAQMPDLRVFVASKAGDIPTGADWLLEIHAKLNEATTFLLLLTPRSITRFWVWYEAGAAWKSGLHRRPVAAAGLDRNHIPLPLSASQTLMLDDPADAAQLFADLGGHLEAPDEFCAHVRALALPAPSAGPDANRIRQVRQAFGELGDPPKLVLRTMLREGGMTLQEMDTNLTAASFPGGGAYVERVRDALKKGDLVEGDADGRWSVRPDVREILQQCFNPPLSRRMLDLAARMRAWTEGSDGLIDGNGFQQKFRTELNLLRDKAATDHAQGDEWLSKIPSSGGGVRGIAEALERVAQRVP